MLPIKGLTSKYIRQTISNARDVRDATDNPHQAQEYLGLISQPCIEVLIQKVPIPSIQACKMYHRLTRMHTLGFVRDIFAYEFSMHAAMAGLLPRPPIRDMLLCRMVVECIMAILAIHNALVCQL